MTFTLEDAIVLATNAHRGQTDKVGEPYILHPLRVMFSIDPWLTDHRIVAVMHDVLEDTAVTVESLFTIHDVPASLIQALVSMTHLTNESYADYIQRVKLNDIARTVKIADIRDNTSMERLLRLDKPTIDRLLKKYQPALTVLENA